MKLRYFKVEVLIIHEIRLKFIELIPLWDVRAGAGAGAIFKRSRPHFVRTLNIPCEAKRRSKDALRRCRFLVVSVVNQNTCDCVANRIWASFVGKAYPRILILNSRMAIGFYLRRCCSDHCNTVINRERAAVQCIGRVGGAHRRIAWCQQEGSAVLVRRCDATAPL